MLSYFVSKILLCEVNRQWVILITVYVKSFQLREEYKCALNR
jgi:hypothetical protein